MAMAELTRETVPGDRSPPASTDQAYLAFRSAVLDPLRLSEGLQVRSYDVSLVVEALAMGAQVLAPDGPAGTGR